MLVHWTLWVVESERLMLGTLVKAIRVLELFTIDSPNRGLTEISKELRLNKSSVFRILQTLQKEGYVKQDEFDSRYSLTAKFLWLGSVVASQMDILKQSKREIDSLWQKTGGTVVLRVIEGSELVTAAIRESSQGLRVSHPIGSRVNFNYGAIGKAILAHLTEQEVHRILESKNLCKFTSKTILSPPLYLQELGEVRRNGFSFSDEEALQGVRAVGAAIFNMSGIPFAGISVGLPVFRFPKSKIGEFGRLVKQAANQISVNLGYKGPSVAPIKVRKNASAIKGAKVKT